MAKLELPYEQVFDLTHKMCTRISPDVLYLLTEAAKKETNPAAKTFLETMVENERLAGIEDKPVCQSPGYPSVWIRWGETYEPNLSNLIDNITRSVVDATKQGYIRPSIPFQPGRFHGPRRSELRAPLREGPPLLRNHREREGLRRGASECREDPDPRDAWERLQGPEAAGA